ncbi:MAG: endonuclease/exonuclease/phosphatase family protein [Bacteroidetes bacterium]|nr:endonuclease/exonuclease/phosphatase family protein [Bacteroidota bacterium]
MKISKMLITSLLVLFWMFPIYSQSVNDTLFIASWNMENLFDAIDDPNNNDEEFLPNGKKEWTQEKIDSKIENQAKVIKWMNNGNGPDPLGVQEVEHRQLLDTLLARNFKNKNYKIAYVESLDKRGIDNGLIYNADKFEVINIKPIEVELPSKYPTRYILEVKLKSKSGEEIFVFVNHWPSRGGGEEKSQPNRIKAALVLREEIDLLYQDNNNLNIVIMGDFNDMPNNLSIARYLWTSDYNCSTIIEPNRLYNLAYQDFTNGNGSYLYRGNWNMLDQIIVSSDVVGKGNVKYICDSFHLIKPDFLIQQDGKYKGSAKPTFGGKTYLGGYSDHIPVAAKFLISK